MSKSTLKFSVFIALLLAWASSFAYYERGSVGFNGLFLLDQADKSFHVWDAYIKDSLQKGSLEIEGDLHRIKYVGEFSYTGKNPMYSWNAKFHETIDVGHVSLGYDTRYLSLKTEYFSFPYMRTRIGWQTGDSTFFAYSGFGRGHVRLLELGWKMQDSSGLIPRVNGYLEPFFFHKDFGAGIKLGNHKFLGSTLFLESEPDLVGRRGFVFTDSTNLKNLNAKYEYAGSRNRLGVGFSGYFIDSKLQGLMREDQEDGSLDEKRFFYVPLEVDVYGASVYFEHDMKPKGRRQDVLSALLAFGYGDIHVPYISWKEGRFYPTLAPNQMLSASIIKTISVGMNNRSYRLFGDGYLGGGVAGFDYRWIFTRPGWRVTPKLGLYGYYVDGDFDLGRRTETAMFMGIEASQDTLEWQMKAFGSVLQVCGALESPGRHFFVSVGMTQLVPFYYRQKNFDALKSSTITAGSVTIATGDDPSETLDLGTGDDESMVHGPSGPSSYGPSHLGQHANKPSEGEEAPLPEVAPEVPPEPEKQSYRLFRNGFALSVQLGIRF